jgi:hypothetical protein
MIKNAQKKLSLPTFVGKNSEGPKAKQNSLYRLIPLFPIPRVFQESRCGEYLRNLKDYVTPEELAAIEIVETAALKHFEALKYLESKPLTQKIGRTDGLFKTGLHRYQFYIVLQFYNKYYFLILKYYTFVFQFWHIFSQFLLSTIPCRVQRNETSEAL